MIKFKTLRKISLIVSLSGTAILTLLKVTNLITLSWFWTLAPFSSWAALAIIALIIYLLLKLFVPKFE